MINGKVMVVGVCVMLGAFVMKMASRQTASTAASDCAPPVSGAPMVVTDDCVDPRFKEPYIDIDEMRNAPAPHRYVHGGFKGTDAKFSFYFPPKEQYQGRFFQPTHQLQTSENASPGNISFAVASGAYWVQTNMGGAENPTTAALTLSGKFDPSIRGYRVNAAAAKYSRTIAAQVYGARRTYGYLHGGSGGAYQTITSAEHTAGVWDGFVPYVMGTPNAIPGNFTVRIHALRVLRLRNKFPSIQHGAPVGAAAELRTVSYQGVLQQALRDVSAWVERGVEPPTSTSYKMVDAQMEVPPKAEARKGIQPVVELKVNNGVRAEVAVGQPVTFSATIETPPNTGKVVAVEWNFEGAGGYVRGELGDIRPAVSVKATHSYSQPGTYFPVLRATSHRDGNADTPFARVQNLGRARVVVKQSR